MGKPEPKTEIIVQEHGDCLNIYTATPDAKSFVDREAPTYGLLLRLSGEAFALYVSPVYDAREVAEYLRNME